VSQKRKTKRNCVSKTDIGKSRAFNITVFAFGHHAKQPFTVVASCAGPEKGSCVRENPISFLRKH